MPLLNDVANFVKDNPQLVKVAAAAAAGLAAIGGLAAVTLLVGAVGSIGVLLGALVGAGAFIAMNWDTIKDAWEHGKPLAPKPLTHDQQTVADAYNFSKPPSTTGVGYLDIQRDMSKQRTTNDFLRDIMIITGKQAPSPFLREDGPGYNYSAPSGQEMLSGAKSVIQGEMVVRFENTPPGTRVSEGKTNVPNVKMTPDVGYSQFSPNYLLR